MAKLFPWRDLVLRDMHGDDLRTHGHERVIAALREFRETLGMVTVAFNRIGWPHETDDDWTWGPESPDDVDWTGFPNN